MPGVDRCAVVPDPCPDCPMAWRCQRSGRQAAGWRWADWLIALALVVSLLSILIF